MKLTNEEKAICKKYRKRDKDGKVHCSDCPLVISKKDRLCKRIAKKGEVE